MKKKIIAMFNLNDTRRDPRVIRIAGTLVKMGYRVIVFDINNENASTHSHFKDFEIVSISIPMSYTKEDMSYFERICPLAADLIRMCNARVMNEGPDTSSPYMFRLGSAICHRLSHLKTRFSGAETQQPDNTLQEIYSIRSIMLINLRLYQIALEYFPDIVISNDLDSLLCGYMFKVNHGLPLMYDAHEIYPEQLPTHLRSDTWYQFYTQLESHLILETDARITVCDSLGIYFERKYGSKPFRTIRNCPSLRHLPPESILNRKNRVRKIIYHGAYFQFRGLEEVLLASKKVPHAEFVFRGIGKHEEVLKRIASDLGVNDRVTFSDPVLVDQLVSSASVCDIGLNPFISVCLNTEFSLPNKFFEYMMAGLAIVSADLIEMRNLTYEYQLGETYDSENVENLAELLNTLISNNSQLEFYRQNAYFKAKEEFNWEMESTKLCTYVRHFLH